MFRRKSFRAGVAAIAALGFGLVAFQGAASAASPHVAKPVVNEVVPSHGPTAGGTSVTIYGYHFAGATAVDFGSTAATSFSVGSNQVIHAVFASCDSDWGSQRDGHHPRWEECEPTTF